MALNNKITNKQGFSLMEFLIVIGIIAVIAVIAVPITIGILNKTEEKNDEVLASTYTEYVQKFANEKAGSAQFYPTLSVGEGSEYQWLSANSGQGKFPGLSALNSQANDATTENDVWDAVRKEVCIVIKAYGEDSDRVYVDENGKYFVKAPTDPTLAFVYYYLTGEIKLKPIEEMNDNKLTDTELQDGNVNTDDYWVYLDREGGSGKVLQEEGKYDFYVQVLVKYETPDTPLSGATVTITPDGVTGVERSHETQSNGMLVFRDVYSSLTINATHIAALPWPDSRNYPGEDNHFSFLNNPSGIGTTPTNPFKIYLIIGTHGDVQFYENVSYYNYNPQGNATEIKDSEAVINWRENNFRVNFTNASNSTKNATFVHSVNNNADTLRLWGYDSDNNFRFLSYPGTYTMTVEDITPNGKKDAKDKFATYTQTVEAEKNGIYKNTSDAYRKTTEAYTYPVYLKRQNTIVKGYIVAEHEGQPLNFTDKPTTTGLGSNDIDDAPFTYSKLSHTAAVVLKSTSDTKKTNLIYVGKSNGCDVYKFEILLGTNNGTEYELYLESLYGTNSKMEIKAWPSKIKADGSVHILNSQTDWENCEKSIYTGSQMPKVSLSNDVDNGKLTVTTYITDNDATTSTMNYIDFVIELTRDNYTTGSDTYYKLESTNGVATSSSIKQGFYTAKYTFESDANADAYAFLHGKTFPVFVDDDTNIDFSLLGLITFENLEYNYVFDVVPKSHNGNELDIDDVLKTVDMSFTVKATNNTGNTDTISGIKGNKGNGIISVILSNDREKITIVSYCPLKDIEVSETSNCFDDTNFSRTNGKYCGIRVNGIAYTTTEYENSFDVYRTEENTKQSFDDWHGDDFSENQTTSKHQRICNDCGFVFEANHYTEFFDGGASGQVEYYAQSTTSETGAVFTGGHQKYCTVCGYSQAETCTAGSFTNCYNLNAESTSSKVISGTTYYKVVDCSATQAKSTSYHYKYCTVCNAKIHKSSHSTATSTTRPSSGHGSCQSGTFNYSCKDDSNHTYTCAQSCGYSFDAGHTSGAEVESETTTDYVYKTYCTGCGHLTNERTVSKHTHSFDYTCGTWHYDTAGSASNWSWNGISGCSEQSSQHCWNCGESNYKLDPNDDDGDQRDICASCNTWSANGTKFSCLTCSCGLTQYAVLPAVLNNKNSCTNWERWCGAHYTIYTYNTKWAASAYGITNQHHPRAFGLSPVKGKTSAQIKAP